MSGNARPSVARAVLCLMCGAGNFLGATSLPAQSAKNPQAAQSTNEVARKDLLAQFNESLQELTARVTPSIVQVQVTGYRALNEKNDTDANTIGRQRSLGSGVIVDSDGYIISNAHVVKGAQRVRVILTPATAGDSQVRASLGLGEHSPPADARIIGIAPTIDLALLKIEQKNLPAMAFADYTRLKKGQLVLAFGSPEGLENSVSMGVVSAVAASGPGRAVGLHPDRCAHQSGKQRRAAGRYERRAGWY